jgi:hypothetical protein
MLRLSTSALRIGMRARHRILPVSLNLYFVVLIAAVTVYYLFLLSNGTFQILAPELLDKVFDNMLVHLLRGEFTVDRDAIDYEAVTRNGRSYTYFGVFPAMLRLLAMPFVDIAQAELARLSCGRGHLRCPSITHAADYAFNLDRIGIAVLYYATGIPYIFKSVPPFAGLLRCCVIEAPPFTPLLTNPLTVLLAGVGLYRLWCRPDLQRRSLVMLRIVLIGHASAVVLILAFFTFTLRYRFDFAPFMTLAAFVGYRSLSMTAAGFSGTWRRRILVAAMGLCVLGVLGAVTISFSSTRCGASACRWVCALPSFPLRLSLTPPLSRDVRSDFITQSPLVETAGGWALRPR